MNYDYDNIYMFHFIVIAIRERDCRIGNTNNMNENTSGGVTNWENWTHRLQLADKRVYA